MSNQAPLDLAVEVAADYLTDNDIPPATASPQTALNALAHWARLNPDTEVGRWLLEARKLADAKDALRKTVEQHGTWREQREHNLAKVQAMFAAFREAWAEYSSSHKSTRGTDSEVPF